MIRVGIGGWVFAPWRGEFYPKGLPQARELEFASRKLTTIEINGTFYATQKPESFRKWAAETPDDFAFSVKGPRFATHRRVLAEAGESIERFFASGVLELKEKLGPILWQYHPSKKFEEDDFAAFLAQLPQRLDGRAIRHAVEVRHESFLNASFIELLRKFSVAIAVVESDKHRLIADVTSNLVYVRLQRSSEAVTTGYPPRALDAWAQRAQDWANGGVPDDLSTILGSSPGQLTKAGCVHVYDLGRQGARAGSGPGINPKTKVRVASAIAANPAALVAKLDVAVERIDGPLYYERMGCTEPVRPLCIPIPWTKRARSHRWRGFSNLVPLHQQDRKSGLYSIQSGTEYVRPAKGSSYTVPP